MSNEITAYFKGRTGVAESVYQYDYGKVLIIDGLNLPAVFEAHFTNTGDDDALTVIGQNNRVAIPNACLESTGIVTVYIYLHSGENDGETEYIVRFAVTQRARPAYDSTAEERSDFESAVQQAIAMLQNPKKVNTPLDAHNQVNHGTAGQLLRTKGNGATEWVNEGLPTDEQTAAAVSAWLDDHPEATTTVQDGSLTEAKFTESLKLKTIKDYVTPQMFGATGDGITDDTDALSDLYDYASEHGSLVLFPPGTYIISDTIYVTSNYDMRNNAIIKVISDSTLEYGIKFSPEKEVKREVCGECFINIDCNFKCTYGIGSGAIARKALTLRINNPITCGFNDRLINTDNNENIINCFVSVAKGQIATYGLITAADNVYNIVTTVNCQYGIYNAGDSGTHINYVHAWIWPEDIDISGDSAVIKANYAFDATYVYQDYMKYAVYFEKRSTRAYIDTLYANEPADYAYEMYKIDSNGNTGQGLFIVHNFLNSRGYELKYTLSAGMIFQIGDSQSNNYTALPFGDLNDLPDIGNFIVNADSETSNVPSDISVPAMLNVMSFVQSYIGVQLLFNDTTAYFRRYRIDNRNYGNWVRINAKVFKAVSSWQNDIAPGDTVDVTFDTGSEDFTNFQATIYGNSKITCGIESYSSGIVTVKCYNAGTNTVSFRVHLRAEK